MNQPPPIGAAERRFRENLAPLLELADRHPDATGLYIDGDRLQLAHGKRRHLLPLRDYPLLTPARIQAGIAAAAVHADREFGPDAPMISVKLPPDLRVSCFRTPVSSEWHADIRFLRSRHLRLTDYVAAEVMTTDQAGELRELMHAGRSILLSGATGSGKTTLLRAMLAEVVGRPGTTEGDRTVIIEDTPELTVEGSDILDMQTVEGVADMAALLRQALRHTPGRLVVGEVRGPEALELCRAANTGHRGVMSTVHSNGREEALWRLLSLCQEAQPTFTMAGVILAIDVVVQIEADEDERRTVTSIWHVPKDEAWGFVRGGELKGRSGL